MKLTFDTTTDGAREAASLIGVLALLHPDVGDSLESLGVPQPAVRYEASQPALHVAHVAVVPPAQADAGAALYAALGGTVPPAPPAAPANPAGLVVDKAGLPWDKRIHSEVAGGGGKINESDGLWRSKRNVSAETVASVTAELKASLSAPAAPAPAAIPTPPPAPPAVPVGAPIVADAPPTSIPPAPVPVAAPAPSPAPPPPAPVAAEETPQAAFTRVMRKASEAQGKGLPVDTVLQIVASLGLPTMVGLLTRPDLIEPFDAMLNAAIAQATGG